MAPSPEWPLEESHAGTGLRRWVGHWWERPAQDETAEASEDCEPALPVPRRWGLSAEAVAHLGGRLSQFWLRFRGCFTTRTRDTSERAYDYLRAQLTMETERNFANMDRTLHGGGWTSPAALYVQLALVGTCGVRPDASRDQGDPGLGPREYLDSG